MKRVLCDSVFLVLRSAFWHMSWVYFGRKIKTAIFNPLLISIVAVIVFWLRSIFHMRSYNEGKILRDYLTSSGNGLFNLLLYEQFELLKQECCGDFLQVDFRCSDEIMICVLVLSLLFR